MELTELKQELARSKEAQLVRTVAHWIGKTSDSAALDSDPGLLGDPVRDALVAAAAAHVRLRSGEEVPGWTCADSRRLTQFWHPGTSSLFANALAHAPLAFSHHGLLIEESSLESV